jgi:hypothetical protein
LGGAMEAAYRFGSEKDERLASGVCTCRDVKTRVVADPKLRGTRLSIEFEEDGIEPADDTRVQKNRRLVIRRSPDFSEAPALAREKHGSASSARIKTTGRPVPSLRANAKSLAEIRRRQPPETTREWTRIRETLSRRRRPVRYDSNREWLDRNMTKKKTVLARLRRIQARLKSCPSLALDEFFEFSATYKGTVYYGRYCGRRREYDLALELIFYGSFEKDFAATTG